MGTESALTDFKPDDSSYIRAINFRPTYTDVAINYIMDKYKIDKTTALSIAKSAVNRKGKKDPVVEYNTRDYNGDLVEDKTTLTGYFDIINSNGYVLAPSLTSYKRHDQDQSITGLYLTKNAQDRAVFKKKKFQAVLDSKPDDEVFFNIRQSTMKVYNNTVSGMRGSETTIFYNPTGHSSLTSTTRCVSGIGNALSESIVGGNRYYKDPDTTIEYLASVATLSDKKKIRTAIDKYNLSIPKPEYIFQVVLETSRMYWANEEKENEILKYLQGLSDEQLCAVAYTNDMYRLRICNEELLYNLITKLGTKVTSEPYDDYEEDIKCYSLDADIEILTKYLCSNELVGKAVDFKAMKEKNDPTLYNVTKTARNVYETLIEYRPLFDAFFYTELLPPNLGYIKDMIRRSIVISDTDSTCCTYDEWVKWYSGNLEYNDTNVRIASSVMALTSIFISHGLKILSRNINTAPEHMTKLAMKNEYFWPTFVVCNITKHYFSLVTICEGVVYPKPKLEIKGSQLLISNSPTMIREAVNKMIRDINEELAIDGTLQVKKYVERIIDIEQTILQDFKDGKMYMFLKETIKPQTSYKGDPDKTKYRDYTMWEEIFKPLYGTAGVPPYVVSIVPIQKQYRKVKNLIPHIKAINPELGDKLEQNLLSNRRNELSILRVPKLIADKKGLPKEIVDVVDIKKTIETVCSALYIIIESLGIKRKPKYLLSEQYNLFKE